MTTTIVAFAFALLALSSPALADNVAAPRPPAFKLRLTLHDGAGSQSFRVVVAPRLPCASASRKAPEQQLELKACMVDDAHLQVDWYTRRGTTEFRGSSILSVDPGATATLGSERDARVEVTVQ
jgi:hypothetical protein